MGFGVGGDEQVLGSVFANVSPLVRRVVAPNSGPFTASGTCSYIVGHGAAAVIDAGPEDPEHIKALLEILRGESVTHIVTTHTHLDHSGAARILKEATGAILTGCSAHYRSASRMSGDAVFDAAVDLHYTPDEVMEPLTTLTGDGWSLQAISTPGHTANHIALRLVEENSLFIGDQVMGWSSTVIVPPDGSMNDYMMSLGELAQREESVFLPGHGEIITKPRQRVAELLSHRKLREQQVLERLTAAPATHSELAAMIYQDIAPDLVRGAEQVMIAHLNKLVAEGRVATTSRDGRFVLVHKV